MTTSYKSHARVEETVAGGVDVDRVAAVRDGLDELDALTIDATHAGERDGEILVAACEPAEVYFSIIAR